MQLIGALLVSFVLGYFAFLAAQLRRQYLSAKQSDELSTQLLKAQIEATNMLKSQREEARLAWNGYRDFQVHGTVNEAKNITSLYLYPHDRKPLPKFQPGQSLTLRLILPGDDEPVERSFPVSSSPSPDFYRITVERNADDPVSNYLHTSVNQHTILKVGAPRGEFCIDATLYRPLAMIAEGVGVAPFVSMIEEAVETDSRRSITLFHSVRNQDEHAMRHHLKALEAQYHNLEVVTIFRDEDESDACDHTGPLTVELLRSVLHSNNFDFYVCGSNQMVSSTKTLLRRWGVSRWNLTTEILDGSVQETASAEDAGKAPATPPEQSSVVSAIRSAVKAAAATPATKTATAAALALAPAATSLS